MRGTRKSNNPSQQQLLNDNKHDVFRQAVEQEYSKLFRQIQKSSQKLARRIIKQVSQRPPPSPLIISFPKSTVDLDSDCDDHIRTVSVNISDGVNQKSEKYSANANIMPTLSSVRELISYVPTMKNIATRGDLTGIPYLGDTFDHEDQQLIDSISGESIKSNQNTFRKKKLDESSLEILYETLRSNAAWNVYSNEEIIDAILHYHRDSTARKKLLLYANKNESSSNVIQQCNPNIDTCDTIDVDIDELLIETWCARFCSRCYTYSCLLHNGNSSHFPLPKQISISNEDQSTPCSSTCYKNTREPLKRSLSPSIDDAMDYEQSDGSLESSTQVIGNMKKRRRKSASLKRVSSSNRLINLDNENLTHDSYLNYLNLLVDTQKNTVSQQLLTRIENHMNGQCSNETYQNIRQHERLNLDNNWTLTDRTLFRLFYFLFDGDLCSVNYIYNDHRTCQDMYKQFVFDAQYFSDRISMRNGSKFSIRQPYRRRMLEGATRAFLFHIKKHMNSNNNTNDTNSNNQKSSKLKSPYQPCMHDGPCTISNEKCNCMKNGTFCEKYCNCSIDCPHRFPGCTCKGACLLNNCLCCAEGRECDPDLCHKCGASLFPTLVNDFNSTIKPETDISTTIVERKTTSSISRQNTRTKTNENLPIRKHSVRSCRTVELSYKTVRNRSKRSNSRASLNSNNSSINPMITCANISLQRKLYKNILIAESDVAGYGAFLGSSIAYPGDLIAEYTGEIISEEEADRRGRLYDKQACSYLFNLDTKRCVDARQFGSKIRFANHSSKPNCVPKIKLVNGDYRIGIYAKQTIYEGEELFFEYMYDAHQQQQFVNNERIDELEQEGLIVLKRYDENFILVRPS